MPSYCVRCTLFSFMTCRPAGPEKFTPEDCPVGLRGDTGQVHHINRQKKRHSKVLMAIMVAALTFPLSALNAQTYKINKYGLRLINDISAYRQRTSRHPDLALVPLDSLIDGIKTDFVYATKDNFTGKVLYEAPRAYLRKPAALALKKIAGEFKKLGYGLLIYDAYRPYHVTEKMWEAVPDNRYAADPRHGSGHNRGLSVDLSLYDLKTGKPLPMPTAFDNFTPKAHQDYQDLPENILKNRALLRKIMTKGGFKPLRTEWWHFSYPGSTGLYLLLDLPFNQLGKPGH